MKLVELDGRSIYRACALEADVVVVGSGPAGAAVARELASRGARVVVLEEGHEARPEDFVSSGLQSMARLYRDMGTSVAFGPAPIPFLQGRAVGGTSVVNGAISWRLPRDVYEGWTARLPGLDEALPYAALQEAEEHVERRLGVQPTDPAVAGVKNRLLAEGAQALGLEHRPIRRNVQGCKGSGRCLQGCPHGAKLSVDRTFLADAVGRGARIVAGVQARRVHLERGRVREVEARSAGGAEVRVRARSAVLAASAVQTPLLLQQSGLRRGDPGAGLMAHPGVSVTGLFDAPVHNELGATQGHEVTGLRREGIKVEALGFDAGILASRLPGLGRSFARAFERRDHHAMWGAALRAEARGRVRAVGGRAFVQYALTAHDLRLAARGVRVLAELFFAAGATEVYPMVGGAPKALKGPAELGDLPLDARAYSMSMTHLFSTAPVGRVVGLDFQHPDARGLYVADSSVFPTSTGVNPQIAIMAVAHLCAGRVAA